MKTYHFIVQGEGRGHLSQALALKEMLENHGHRVERIYTGCMEPDRLPAYYIEAAGKALTVYRAPGFLADRQKKGIRLLPTFLLNLSRLPRYLEAVRFLRKSISEASPDAVINFCEISGALAMRRLHSSVRRIAVGHHFYYSHPDAHLPAGFPLQRRLLQWHNRLIMRSADQVLALSFRPAPDFGSLKVVPPLIPMRLKELKRKAGRAYLAYFLYPGFIEDFVSALQKIQSASADIYTAVAGDYTSDKGVGFHLPDREAFIMALAGCRGLVTTAGFESVAEAGYLGVPVLTVATGRHFEQACNALDMERAGLGLRADLPDPALLNDGQPMGFVAFRAWADRAEECLMALFS